MTITPVYAHGGLSAGADNVATILVIAAVIVLAWFRIVQRRTPKPERPPWLFGLPVLAALLIVAAVATPSFVRTTEAKKRPATTARIVVLSPVQGATTGRKVAVKLDLIGARLAPLDALVTGKLPTNRGHIHLTLDRQLLMIPTLDYTLDVSPGPHTLTAEFAAMDHGSFDPPVVAAVTFTATSDG